MVTSLKSQSELELQARIEYVTSKIKILLGRADEPVVVVSPYRINPLGAHIDHQGGSVLARTIDQYTILAFYSLDVPKVVLHCDNGELADKNVDFHIGATLSGENWIRYAMASANSLASHTPNIKGFEALVYGSLVGSGLSSSASVILAYITGLAHVNNIELSQAEMVELAREIENEYMGLNNGIQDQMSVVFGRNNALSLLDMGSVTTRYIEDPPNCDEVCWVMCYSGFSRELVSSGFNDRVRECREAANFLDANAAHLGEVREEYRHQQNIAQLPDHLGRRAKHVYGESERVAEGCDAWHKSHWVEFGQLMNESCQSSISNYECGSEAMIELHRIALEQDAVYGSRFGGGGYGGCLMMLTKSSQADAVKREVLDLYVQQFPEKRGIAKTFIATAEKNVRIVDA